jgi:hypothetical protein
MFVTNTYLRFLIKGFAAVRSPGSNGFYISRITNCALTVNTMTSLSVPLHSLCLLAPGEIPFERELLEWSLSNALSSQRKLSVSSPATTSQSAGEIRRLIRALNAADCSAASVSEQSDDVAHDDYFHVSRVHGCASTLFLQMSLEARLCLLQDVMDAPVNVGLSVLEQMDRALVALSTASFTGNHDMGCIANWETSGGGLTADQAMSRWVRGHQIFAALSQGLIFSFREMARAIKEADEHAIRRWAELSISLLEGSGAAFVFTGDFSIEVYMTAVRPTMMPPEAPINLSGLMSVDHRFLVQTIRDMRPALRALHELEPELHGRIQTELATVYDRHAHVCERFVGEKPSLLTAHSGKKSGPQLIEQFKSLRLKVFEVQAHATRLNESCPVAHAATPKLNLSLVASGSVSEAEAFTHSTKDL